MRLSQTNLSEDFIYITTQTLNPEKPANLSEDVGEKKSLLVMCSAFRARDVQNFTSLTIKKIPKTVLTWCEWGKDDYSLEIKNLAAIQSSDSEPIESVASTRRSRKARAKTSDQPTLFDLGS